MAKQPRKLSKDEVLARVLPKAQSSVSWFDSRLSKERERVTRYLNGELPKRRSEGSSSYVSTDVYDAVEMMTAQVTEVFSGGDHIATFDPGNGMNADLCRIATEYASYVIFRENPGNETFGNVIYDGLTARAGIAQVYWEEKYEYIEETFEGLPHDDAHALASQDDVDSFDAEETAVGSGIYAGKLMRKKDCSKITIEAVAPEEFLIEARARSKDKAQYKGRRQLKTKAELIAMGYPKDKVMDVPLDDAKSLEWAPEAQARNHPTVATQDNDDPIQDELQYVILYESYVNMQVDPEKGVCMYKVVHAGNTVFELDEVDKDPFLVFVPLPVPHVFYGNNFAARVIGTQNARTVLMRGILDHTATTTNPRWQVVNGGLMNPREMLENRMGGLVNVRRPDSVVPLPQNNLNPYVFNTLTLLTDNSEKSTGISALSQGLSKDAISNQNSRGLVDDMIKVSSVRQKRVARNFVYQFLIPLMIEVIRLAILHDNKGRVIEVAGQPMQVDPRQWTERTTCTVSPHLGFGEKDVMVNKMTVAHKTLTETAGTMYGPKQKYALLMDTMKMAGLTGAPNYLDPNAPPPQPDPLKVQELGIKDKMAQAALAQASAAQQKDNRLLALDQTKLGLEGKALQLKALDHDRTHDRQDMETAARVDVAQREVKMLEKHPPTKTTGSANPSP
jgi:hypothetical protein